MNEKEFKIKTKTIKETFGDDRRIKCIVQPGTIPLDKNIHQGGDIFKTEDDELIDLEFQNQDFDEEELVKYIELAEELYKQTHKRVHIYLMCPKNVDVCVRECDIKSEADFTIRLACIVEDPCQIILDNIKEKIRHGELLNCTDIEDLKMLPVRCDKKDRHYFRLESLKIINRMIY